MTFDILLDELDYIMREIDGFVDRWIEWDRNLEASYSKEYGHQPFWIEERVHEELYFHLISILNKANRMHLLESEMMLLNRLITDFVRHIETKLYKYYEECVEKIINNFKDYTIISPNKIEHDILYRYLQKSNVNAAAICILGKILLLPIPKKLHNIVEDIIVPVIIHEEFHKVIYEECGWEVSKQLDSINHILWSLYYE